MATVTGSVGVYTSHTGDWSSYFLYYYYIISLNASYTR
jgi:hypothetical protein